MNEQKLEFLDRFPWKFTIYNFTAVRQVGAAQIHTDRQTDMSKLIGTFPDYVNAQNKRGPCSLLHTLKHHECVTPHLEQGYSTLSTPQHVRGDITNERTSFNHFHSKAVIDRRCSYENI
jgi:hypothetical protein